MKKSNIIITSLIASITLILTTGMMELRIKGVPHGSGSVVPKPLEFKEASIPEFHFLVVEGGWNVSLETSDAFSIGMINLPDSVPKPSYQVQNDTLYIKGFSHPERSDFISVKTPAQQVKWVRALNSQVIVNNFSLDQFFVHLDGSKISLMTQQEIKTLIVEGVNGSRIDLSQSDLIIKTLDLNLDHSEIYAFVALGKLKGSIRNQSRAQLKDVAELNFTKDGTSHLQVWSE